MPVQAYTPCAVPESAHARTTLGLCCQGGPSLRACPNIRAPLVAVSSSRSDPGRQETTQLPLDPYATSVVDPDSCARSMFSSEAERWAELRPEGRRPAARYGHSASYEEAAHAMLFFGGPGSKKGGGN